LICCILLIEMILQAAAGHLSDIDLKQLESQLKITNKWGDQNHQKLRNRTKLSKKNALRKLTIKEIASDVGLPFGPVQSVLTEVLGMRTVSAKFIPKLSSDEQRDPRGQVCTDLLEACRGA